MNPDAIFLDLLLLLLLFFCKGFRRLVKRVAQQSVFKIRASFYTTMSHATLCDDDGHFGFLILAVMYQNLTAN